MPDYPRRRDPREEPDSDRPPKPRTAFVTRDEVEAMMSESITPVLAIVRRIEAESIEARKERMRRKRIEDEIFQKQKRDLELQGMRAKMESESDLVKAQIASLQRPATPVMPWPPQVVSVQMPQAPDSDGELPLKPSKRHRNTVIVAVISGVVAVLVAAIGAWASQHGSPHGVVDPVPTGSPHH